MFHTATVCLKKDVEVRPNYHTGGPMASPIGANQCVHVCLAQPLFHYVPINITVCIVCLFFLRVCICDSVNAC